MIMLYILILMSAAYIPTIGTSAQRAPRPTAVGAPAPQCHTTRIFSVNSKLQYFLTTHIACKASCNIGPSLMIQHSMSKTQVASFIAHHQIIFHFIKSNMVCVLSDIRLHRVSCNHCIAMYYRCNWLTGNAGRRCVAQRIEDLTMADSYSQLWGLQHSNVTRSLSLSLSRKDKMQNIINIQTLWDCFSSNLDHDGHVRHVRVSQNKFYTKSVCTPF